MRGEVVLVDCRRCALDVVCRCGCEDDDEAGVPASLLVVQAPVHKY
jgi:hypothetical protein